MTGTQSHITRDNRFWTTPWKLSLLAGILLGMGFPPVNMPFLQIPAFICLFRIADLSDSGRRFRLNVYPALLIWNIITTYWLMLASIAAGTAAILLNALLMLIPLSMIRTVLNSSVNRVLAALITASVWCGYEFLIHNWDLAWTWLTLANGWANLPSLIQYISFTGYLSVSFWVVLTAFLFYHFILTENHRFAVAAAALFLSLPMGSLIIRPSLDLPESSTPLEVTVVQPDIDSYLTLGGYNSVDDLVTSFLAISDSATAGGTDLIVWPENSIDSSITLGSPVIARIRDSLRVWGSDLIAGAVYREMYNDPSEEPPLVYGRYNGVGYNIFNAAIHLSPDISPDPGQDIYKKANLVPLVERTPYADILSRLDIFTSLDWGRIAGYGKGTRANNLLVDGELTPALVCYDSVFPHWTGEFVRNGATFITIITNDGWWGNTSGHAQHFAYARLRAIEYRRWIVRSANNGISGIINPAGGVEVSTRYGERTAFTHTIHPDGALTLYARYGNWFNRLLTAVGFAGWIYAWRLSRRQPVRRQLIPTEDSA